MSSVMPSDVQGRLIVIEGPDRVGKTAVTEAVLSKLNADGQVLRLMTFPGKVSGTVGKLVYDVHHRPKDLGVDAITPTSVQALHIAAHLDAIESQILPTLAQGIHVLLDRYWWSTWVYGVVTGCNREVLAHLIDAERSMWRVEPAVGIVIRREKPLGDEIQDVPMWEALRTEYDRLADRERSRHPVRAVANEGDFSVAVEAILHILQEVGVEATVNSSKAPRS
jgi:dTMP kinase